MLCRELEKIPLSSFAYVSIRNPLLNVGEVDCCADVSKLFAGGAISVDVLNRIFPMGYLFFDCTRYFFSVIPDVNDITSPFSGILARTDIYRRSAKIA